MRASAFDLTTPQFSMNLCRQRFFPTIVHGFLHSRKDDVILLFFCSSAASREGVDLGNCSVMKLTGRTESRRPEAQLLGVSGELWRGILYMYWIESFPYYNIPSD